jgi:hypothetical protein
MTRRYLSVPHVVGLCASVGLVAILLPSPARAERDICVKILPPVKSQVAVKPEGGVTGGRARASDVWSVDVTIGDCVGPGAGGGGAAPPVWPPLSFATVLDVSSEGRSVCSTNTTTHAVGNTPARKVFRFQLVYPPREPGATPSTGTVATVPLLYTIRATAQVTDGSPANNQGTATLRFAPGGAPSCTVLP